MKPFDPRVLRLVPAARGPVAALAALAALSGLAAIGQAFAVSAVVVALVTDLSPHPPAGVAPSGSPALATCLLWAIGCFAVRGVTAGATEVLAAHTAGVVSGALRVAVVAARLGHGEDDPVLAPQRLVTLATQGASSIETYVTRYLPTLVAAVVLPPATIVAMAFLDWRTALIPVLTIWLLPLFAALIGVSTREATQKRWRTAAALAGHFLDVMRGLPTLSAYGRARHQSEVIRTVSEDHRRASVTTLRLAFLSSAALELLATVCVALVAVWVGLHLAAGSLSLATALPLILLAPEAYWPIRRVGAEFHNAADGSQAIQDVAEVLAAASAPAPAPLPARDAPGSPSSAAPVLLSAVGYRYADHPAPVLHDLDARLRVGLNVITGPSGVGKTTLLELLAGVRRPSTGVVAAPPAHLVTQRPFLAALTLAENLRLGAPAATGERLAWALDRVGLSPMVAQLPRGLDTLLGDDGFGLSAGQRARVAVARAMLSDKELLLFDEPTAHLDPQAEALVHDVITDLARDRVVVAVTHRPGLLDLADATLTLRAPVSQRNPTRSVSIGGAP